MTFFLVSLSSWQINGRCAKKNIKAQLCFINIVQLFNISNHHLTERKNKNNKLIIYVIYTYIDTVCVSTSQQLSTLSMYPL